MEKTLGAYIPTENTVNHIDYNNFDFVHSHSKSS